MPPRVSGVQYEEIPQSREEGAIDRFGITTVTRTEFVPATDFSRLLRAVYSVHPDFPTLAASRVNYQKVAGGKFYQVSYVYEGYLAELPDPTYDFQGAAGEEPIETHPDFGTFAGTPASPANGAVFVDPATGKPTTDNDKGVFQEFRARVGANQNPFAGVTSFVDFGATWTKTYHSTSRPSDIPNIGKIDNPDGTPPTLDGRNWLLVEVSYTRRGSVYEIRKTWQASGIGGWNEDIYGT